MNEDDKRGEWRRDLDFLTWIGIALTERDEIHLRPSPYNKVNELKGRTPDKEKHKVTVKSLIKYTNSFRDMKHDIDAFNQRIALPVPRLGLGLLGGPDYAQRLKDAGNPFLMEPPPLDLRPDTE